MEDGETLSIWMSDSVFLMLLAINNSGLWNVRSRKVVSNKLTFGLRLSKGVLYADRLSKSPLSRAGFGLLMSILGSENTQHMITMTHDIRHVLRW